MPADTTAVFDRDTFRGRINWLALRFYECAVEDEDGQRLCHCRAEDRTCRRPLAITTEAGATVELLRIQRPEDNFRAKSVHEGIPRMDNVYLVTDMASNRQVGVVQKPWLRGIWRDLWIVRNADWIEICRVEQSSLLRALACTFVTALPSRFRVVAQARRLGTLSGSWRLARSKISVDLREDHQRTLDRRLAIALVVILLTR